MGIAVYSSSFDALFQLPFLQHAQELLAFLSAGSALTTSTTSLHPALDLSIPGM